MTPVGMNPVLRQVLSELVDVNRRAGNLGAIDEHQASALKLEICDAFAKGDVDPALNKLLDLAKTRPQKIAVEQLIDSALISFGVDVSRAKASWQTAFDDLAKVAQKKGPPSDLRSSPIRDAFRGMTMRLDERTISTLKRQSHQQARLEAGLKVALGSDEKLEALRDFEQNLPLKTPDNILMGLLVGYREEEAWADMVRVFKAAPEAFRAHLEPRREFALALAMSGEHNHARRVLSEVMKDGDHSAATYGLLGRVLKSQYDRLAEAGSPVAPKVLNAAISTYRNGFKQDVSELYPGVALPVLLEARGDPASLKELQNVAALIKLNASRRASFGERHFWDAAAALEMSCSLRDWPAAEHWADQALLADSEPWMRRTTVLNLKRLLEIRTDRGEDCGTLKALISKLESVPATQRKANRTPRAVSSAKPTSELTSERALAAVLDGTYRFGGRSPKWLSGNYSYEGIAHDVRVTPADVVYFERIMKSAGIDQIDDLFQASAAMDAVIRDHYQTLPMENLQSEEHQRYDRVMPGLKSLMAATRENSQTNVSADWINQLGDCRQHAPAKLMMWEVWKRKQVSSLMLAIREAYTRNEPHVGAKLEKKLREVNAWEMRILDAEIVDAKSGKLLEPHTMTFLIKRKLPDEPGGEMRELEKAYLADSFYQNVHHLGSGEIDVQVKDGKLWIEVPAPSSDGRKIALRPAPYSFDRAAHSFDFGQLKFRGVQVASPGWEHEIPVEGVDLAYLHAYVDAPPAGDVAAP